MSFTFYSPSAACTQKKNNIFDEKYTNIQVCIDDTYQKVETTWEVILAMIVPWRVHSGLEHILWLFKKRKISRIKSRTSHSGFPNFFSIPLLPSCILPVLMND